MLNLLSLAISCCGTSKREYIMVQQRALEYLHAPNIQVVSKAPFLSHQANLLFILYTILFSLTRRQVWKVPPETLYFHPTIDLIPKLYHSSTAKLSRALDIPALCLIISATTAR